MLQDGLRCSDAALRIAGGVRGLKALALSASDTILCLIVHSRTGEAQRTQRRCGGRPEFQPIGHEARVEIVSNWCRTWVPCNEAFSNGRRMARWSRRSLAVGSGQGSCIIQIAAVSMPRPSTLTCSQKTTSWSAWAGHGFILGS